MSTRPVLIIADPEAVRLTGDALTLMGERRFAEARLLLQTAVEKDAKLLAARLNLATLARIEGDFAGALDSVGEALKIDPLCFPALLMRATILEAMGKSRQAALAYNVALTQLPRGGQLDETTRQAVAHAEALCRNYSAELDQHLQSELSAEAGSGQTASSRRMRHFLDHLSGKRRPYHQEPTAFYYPGLPSVEFWDREYFPWLETVEAATEEIRAELIAVLEDERKSAELEPYMQRAQDEPVQQWAELNFNPRWSAYHFALYGEIYHEHRRECPKTAAILDQVPYPVVGKRMPAALFSVLRPNTHIPPHNGAGNVRLLCHLPLIVPPDCGFRCGNTMREWKPGEAFVFDDTIEHEAWNKSDQTRAVLIFDIWNPLLTADERLFITHTLEQLDEFIDEDGPDRASP